MVTLIMMLVISLIVIGFTQTARRTSREALDSQLSSQAFYAAESGINMTAPKISKTSTPKTDCSNSGDYTITQSLAANVAVTCVLVTPNPPDIKIFADQASSTIVPINNSTPLRSLTFQWTPPTGMTTVSTDGCNASSGTFPTSVPDNCSFALLRVDLMQKPSALSFDSLANNTLTFYMQPLKTGGGSASVSNFAAATKGNVVGALCDSTTCKVTITLSDGAQGTAYYARLSTLYRDTPQVIITGTSNGTVNFTGAQVVIDSTGKAQDVLRRVQARYSIGITHAEAPYAVESGSTICKRFTASAEFFDNNCNN